MTRKSATAGHVKEMYIEIHPQDADELNIHNGDVIEVESRRGKLSGKAKVTDSVSPKMIFLPFHFAESSANLLTCAVVDDVSETPGFKISAVSVNRRV